VALPVSAAAVWLLLTVNPTAMQQSINIFYANIPTSFARI